MDAERVGGGQTGVEKVVQAVADEMGVPSTDLPPIGKTIDADLLYKIVNSESRAGFESVEFTFIYAGHEVVVEAGEGTTVQVTKKERPAL